MNLDTSPVEIADKDVITCFKRVNPHKAPGPDGFHGRILKTCSDQLGPVFAKNISITTQPSYSTNFMENVKHNSSSKDFWR